jgi:hypothetical protein
VRRWRPRQNHVENPEPKLLPGQNDRYRAPCHSRRSNYDGYAYRNLAKRKSEIGIDGSFSWCTTLSPNCVAAHEARSQGDSPGDDKEHGPNNRVAHHRLRTVLNSSRKLHTCPVNPAIIASGKMERSPAVRRKNGTLYVFKESGMYVFCLLPAARQGGAFLGDQGQQGFLRIGKFLDAFGHQRGFEVVWFYVAVDFGQNVGGGQRINFAMERLPA